MFQKLAFNKKKMHIIFLLLFIVGSLTIASIIGFATQNTIPHGVTLGSWNISGLSYEEFYEQLAQKINNLKQQSVVISSEHIEHEVLKKSYSFKASEFGIKLNTDAATASIRALHTGSLWERAKHRWQLRHTHMSLQKPNIDTATAKTHIQKHWGAIDQTESRNAQRLITPNDQVKYVPEQHAYRIQWDRLFHDIVFELGYIFSTPLPDGQQLPVIQLQVSVMMPEITMNMLKKQGIERKITEFTTSYRTSGDGRVHNIESTAEVIHNLLLKPGEIFDYSKIVKDTEQQHGFKPAPVILNGKMVQGVGGGICQISSTLYNAVLLGGLEIVERRHHSLPVKYVPLGQDATFATGYINFKFRNSTEHHILVRVETNNKQVTVKLFGTAPASIKHEIKSEIVQTIKPSIKYVQNTSLARGTQKIIQHGESGYVVDTHRITRKDGEIIKEEQISRDRYNDKPTIIAINPKDLKIEKSKDKKKPVPKKQIIEDGVSALMF